jgi:hypothetical protein
MKIDSSAISRTVTSDAFIPLRSVTQNEFAHAELAGWRSQSTGAPGCVNAEYR